MRKNGSRLISVKQYRASDLFVFALILVTAEVLRYYAGIWFPFGAFFTFSLAVPIVLTVMMRWGWPSILHMAVVGITVSIINAKSATGVQFTVYIIGYMLMSLMLIPAYLIGRDKICKRWWASVLFVVGGWLCAYLGKSVVWAIGYGISPVDGLSVWAGFEAYAIADLLSLVMAVVIVLVLRRFDGMFEDQMTYLKRLDKERRDRMRYDSFGDEPVEIDEESLSILNRDNDLYD